MSTELQKQELKELLDKIQEHLANSSTLSELKLKNLRFETFAGGERTCCSLHGNDTINLPDFVPCPPGYREC